MTSSQRSQKILVVDDELQNVELLQRRLSRRHYAVTTALSAAEACECLAAERPDLILLDIMMPEVSGLDLLLELRADPVTTAIPVILVSAMADTGDIVRGLRLGADDYVTKPIDFPVLLARLEARLQGARIQQSSERQAEILAQLAQVDQAIVKSFEVEADLASTLSDQDEPRHEGTIWEDRPTAQVPRREEDKDTGDYFAVDAALQTDPEAPAERSLFDVLEVEVGQSVRGKHAVTLMVVEPDQIQDLKQAHGRDVGVELVGKVVQRLAGVLPRTAGLYRYQGTIFCAVLADIAGDDALILAERMATVVSREPFQTHSGPFEMTVSIGIATLDPSVEGSPLELFERALSAYEHARQSDRSAIWMSHREGILTPHGPGRVPVRG